MRPRGGVCVWGGGVGWGGGGEAERGGRRQRRTRVNKYMKKINSCVLV